MGHLNETDLKIMAIKEIVTGITVERDAILKTCEICVQGKHAQIPLPKNDIKKSSKLLEIVHSDVCGPMKTPSKSGKRYFVTFIDDFSRWCAVYFLRDLKFLILSKCTRLKLKIKLVER